MNNEPQTALTETELAQLFAERRVLLKRVSAIEKTLGLAVRRQRKVVVVPHVSVVQLPRAVVLNCSHTTE
jgi:hypothetical protein